MVSVRALDAVEAGVIRCRATAAARELRDAAFVVAKVCHNGVTAIRRMEFRLVSPRTHAAGKFVLCARLVAGFKQRQAAPKVALAASSAEGIMLLCRTDALAPDANGAAAAVVLAIQK